MDWKVEAESLMDADRILLAAKRAGGDAKVLWNAHVYLAERRYDLVAANAKVAA
jgi:hypothetical protein